MKTIPYASQKIDQGDIREVLKVLKSDWITQGPKVEAFERALCRYTGAKYAVCVSSGTAALHIAALAANIQPGDEVITSPITFVASANCVLYSQGKPVFADVQEDTANIDPAEIKRKLNRKTKGIIPVHYGGYPCDLREISKIAKEKNLFVIEDASHALGATYLGNRIGSCKYSDMSVFSFHPVKGITSGEGGAILTNQKKLYKKLLDLRSHGITRNTSIFRSKNKRAIGSWYYEMQSLGFNYRITDFQCALGLNQLKKLNQFIKKRNEIASLYKKHLSKLEELELPVEEKNIRSAWHLYSIRLRPTRKNKNGNARKKFFDYLKKKQIGAQVHYIPVYLNPYYRKLGYKKGLCPKAESFYQREISIPLYPSLKKKEINYVIKTIFKYFRK